MGNMKKPNVFQRLRNGKDAGAFFCLVVCKGRLHVFILFCYEPLPEGLAGLYGVLRSSQNSAGPDIECWNYPTGR